MLVSVPKGKHNSGKTLNRCILEGSSGSKKQKKAEEKMETSLQCDFVVPWDEPSAIIGCPCATGWGRESYPKTPLVKYLYIT